MENFYKTPKFKMVVALILLAAVKPVLQLLGPILRFLPRRVNPLTDLHKLLNFAKISFNLGQHARNCSHNTQLLCPFRAFHDMCIILADGFF